MQAILATDAPSSSSGNLFGERAFGVSGPSVLFTCIFYLFIFYKAVHTRNITE